jgi:hypothetical protein
MRDRGIFPVDDRVQYDQPVMVRGASVLHRSPTPEVLTPQDL